MSRIDANCSGKLSCDEFVNLFKIIYQRGCMIRVVKNKFQDCKDGNNSMDFLVSREID